MMNDSSSFLFWPCEFYEVQFSSYLNIFAVYDFEYICNKMDIQQKLVFQKNTKDIMKVCTLVHLVINGLMYVC